MVRRFALLGLLASVVLASTGCGYGAMAVAPNGTVYIARNDNFLFGALRQVYACIPAGAALNCTAVGAP
jgi:hypothetical protein